MPKPRAISRQEVKACLDLIKGVGDLIRLRGEIPNGHLYAELMPTGMTLETYTQIIAGLKLHNLVKESDHMLTWTGPGAKDNWENGDSAWTQ